MDITRWKSVFREVSGSSSFAVLSSSGLLSQSWERDGSGSLQGGVLFLGCSLCHLY